MNIISCERCGVVLDKDRIFEPDMYDHDSGEAIKDNIIYINATKSYAPAIECPVCECKISYENGNSN